MDMITYALSKKYTDESLKGAGALAGKSAYELAVEQGFKGTELEWIESLKSPIPYIGENGNWFIDGEDTGIIATPTFDGVLDFNNLEHLPFKYLEGVIDPENIWDEGLFFVSQIGKNGEMSMTGPMWILNVKYDNWGLVSQLIQTPSGQIQNAGDINTRTWINSIGRDYIFNEPV